MSIQLPRGMNLRLLPFAAVLCVASSALQAQVTLRTPADSAQRVVQRFYDWYVARAINPHGRDMVMIAAVEGPLPFDAELVHWLRVDSTARARAVGEIDGLDGDPYLNAQDPCDRYTARSAVRHGASFYVSVRGQGGCTDHAQPDVVVEVVRRAKGWTIVEFRDPRGGNEGTVALLRRLHPTAG